MPKGTPQKLPTGIAPKTRTKNGKTVPVMTEDGTPVYRVRVWDPALKKQVERVVEGLDAAKELLDSSAKRSGGLGGSWPNGCRFVDIADRYLVAYKTKRDGTPRPSHRWPKSGHA